MFNRKTEKPAYVAHFETMQETVDQFNKLEMKASDENDEACFQKLDTVIKLAIKNGASCWHAHLPTIKSLSDATSAASKEVFTQFGNERIPTPIGAKSYAFIKLVFLANYQKLQHLDLEAHNFAEQVPVSLLAGSKKKEYKEKAELLSVVLAKFSENNKVAAAYADDMLSKMSKVDVEVTSREGKAVCLKGV